MIFSRKNILFLLALMSINNFTLKASSEIESITAHVKKHKSFYTAVTLVAIIIKLIYENRERLSDEALSSEVQAQRWQEIIDCKDRVDQARLFIAYFNDFYLFGRRPKIVGVVINNADSEGSKFKMKDKKVLIKGRGLIAWLHTKIFDKLEPSMKLGATLIAAIIAIDKLRSEGVVPGNSTK
jgi:hypothetical protein